MEMQIPQLRQLFEARVGQISGVLAEDPPLELGSIDRTMRVLKGFVFTLEGMLRKDELQCLPFTARQELFDRVGQAVEALETLPESLSRQQAMDVLRVMDSLHRLCLQENLMASNLDASKLGKLTVILERKLGDVLKTIDGVAEMGEGRAGQIEQATGQYLAEIQGTCKKETEIMASSASLAVESIRSQAEAIRKRQAEAMEAIDQLQKDLRQKREQCQTGLDEQLAVARRMVDETRGEQQAAQELLARAREQLSTAETAIETTAKATGAVETAREELREKLSEGREAIASIRGLAEAGTQTAAEVDAKVAEAEKQLASIQQTADQCAELSDEARQQQEQALVAVQATAQAAERVQAEARQELDEQLEAAAQMAERTQIEIRQKLAEQLGAAAKVLAEIESNGEAAADTLAQVAERMQAEARQKLAEQLEAAAQMAEHTQAEAREKLDEQIEAAAQALAGIESDGKATAHTLAQVKQQRQAVNEAGKAVAEAHQAVTEARQAAAESYRQAEEELTQLRALLAQGGQAAGQLDGLVQAGGDLKGRMARTLAEAGQSREQIAQLEGEASEAAAEIRQRKQEALEAAREAVSEAERLHRQFEQAVSERREAARDAVAALRGDQAIAADLLGRTQQDIEALQGEVRQIHDLRAAAGDAEGDLRAKLDQAGSVVEKLGGVLAAGGELKTQVEGHLAHSAEARGRVEQLARETAASAEDLLSRQGEALAAVRGEAAAAEAQRKACEASFAEQLASAQAVVADLGVRKETAEGLVEQTRQQRDAAQAAGEATDKVRLATAEAAGDVQARLQEARRAAADLAGLLSAGTETRSRIDTELAAAAHAAGEAGTIRRELGEFFDNVQQHRQELAEAKTQSQQLIADIRGDGQQALDGLAEQNADLVARNEQLQNRSEQLQQELEDLLGQTADAGLFRQFDDLAEQSAPRRAKWLRLLIGSASGGAVVLATASALLAGVSAWAAWAVLVAGLVPLAMFLHFCATQYNAERDAGAQHQLRAVVSRSLTAYRKLLSTMQAEGIAESAYVDRMLSSLFGAPADQGQAPEPVPALAAEPPDAQADAEQGGDRS